MAVLDTLEILIEADSAGLSTQLKNAAGNITSFVSQMNRQEVNWTQILSKTISPALIAGIAATFAASITQAMQLQNAVTSSSQSAGSAFGNSAGAMTDSALALSSATGESATDIATAMGVVGQSFKDTATAQAVLNTVTDEAYIKGTSVVDMANLLVPLFKQWNVNATDVPQTMADINAAVQAGTIPFQELISNLTTVGPALQNYTNLADAAGQTELVSAQPGMNSESALNGLSTLAKAVQEPLSQVGVMLSGITSTIKTGGISSGFAEMTAKLQGFGAVAQTIGQTWGLSANTISTLLKQNATDLKQTGVQWDSLKTKVGTLDSQMTKSETATKDLTAAWVKFNNDLQKFVVPAALGALTTAISLVDDAVKGLGETVNDPAGALKLMAGGDFWSAMAQNFAKLGNTITFGAAGKLGNALGNFDTSNVFGKTFANIGAGAANLLGLPDTPTGTSNANVTSNPVTNQTINVNVSNPTGDPQVAGNKVASTLTSLYSGSQR